MPAGYLRSSLALLVAEGPAHGYELMDRVRTLGLPCVDCALLYRALRAMESEHLVTSSWEGSRAGPDRRMYRLTPAGIEWLRQAAPAVADTRRCIGGFLSRFDRLAGRTPARPAAVGL